MREYRINLLEVFETMSFRRFMVLLGGLSGESLLMQTLTAKDNQGEGHQNLIEDPVTAERTACAAWGLPYKGNVKNGS